MVKYGNQGDEVQQWQIFLNQIGYDLVADGIFGQQTYNATVHFQQSYGLGADGIVGRKTYEVAYDVGYDGDY